MANNIGQYIKGKCSFLWSMQKGACFKMMPIGCYNYVIGDRLNTGTRVRNEERERERERERGKETKKSLVPLHFSDEDNAR